MPSLNIDLNYFDHRKTGRLIRLLGKGAELLPIRLWCYCGRHHAEDGALTGYSAQEIESKVAWWGRSGSAVEAMVEAGFLDQVENGFQVHNWQKRAGHIIRYAIRAAKAAQSRWAEDATSNATSIPTSNASALHCTGISNLPSESESKKDPGGGAGEGRSQNVAGPGYATPDIRAAAKRLVKAYQAATATAHDPRGGENAVIAILMSGGATEPQLAATVEEFARHARKTYKPGQRLSAKNFFGGEAPAWSEWLDGQPVVDQSAAAIESAAAGAERTKARLSRVNVPLAERDQRPLTEVLAEAKAKGIVKTTI